MSEHTPAEQQALDALHAAEAALEGQATTTAPTEAPAVETTPERIAFEKHAAAKQTPPWLVAGAKALHQWGQGRELTEAEFDHAIKAAGSIRIS